MLPHSQLAEGSVLLHQSIDCNKTQFALTLKYALVPLRYRSICRAFALATRASVSSMWDREGEVV